MPLLIDTWLYFHRFDDHYHDHFVGIEKEKLHHTSSLPDTLEGEAAFLEDDYEASQVTHRQSFVAMDIGKIFK